MPTTVKKPVRARKVATDSNGGAEDKPETQTPISTTGRKKLEDTSPTAQASVSDQTTQQPPVAVSNEAAGTGEMPRIDMMEMNSERAVDNSQLMSREPMQRPLKSGLRYGNSRAINHSRAIESATEKMATAKRPMVQAPQGSMVARRNMQRNESQAFDGQVDGRVIPDAGVPAEEFSGMLDLRPDGSGVLRGDYKPTDNDAYISASQVRRFGLRPGDVVSGPARRPKENERYWGLLRIEKINGVRVAELGERAKFSRLTPVFPDERLTLEIGPEPLSNRLIDLVAPVGKGQRAIIVSPPKAGKTTILKNIATGVAQNHPDCHLMAVLIGERPEEVTDLERHMAAITKGLGEVASSNFDEQATEQVRVAELALERARRMVEMGADVIILMDSITRLARAYNLAMPTSGRTLSGGFDPAALYPPKRFFGAARNFEHGGSLTIIATALVDTGSRMDDLVYEEFKGTGNQELHLSRKLAQRRIWPAIDVQKSGTRRDDLLFSQMDYQSIVLMHRMFDMLNEEERTEVLLERLRKTKSNKEFLAGLKDG